MKLVDWISRQPAHVSFGRRGSSISAVRGASSVTLLSDSGATVEIPAASPTLAGMMAAADRVRLDALAGAVSPPLFDTRAAATAASLPVATQALRLAGFAAPGDRGAALYRRAAAEPAHPGKLRSADGAWWEIAEPRIFAEMLGAVGNGATDSTAAIEAALATLEAHGGGMLHFGPGTFIANINPAGGGRTKIRGIVGERDGTILRVPATGTFAISKAADQEFSVEGITFDGTVGGVTRRGCGVYLELRGDVVDCRFQNCLIGYARQNAFYGAIDRCRFQVCDLGIFAGTRKAGTETITGLKDGSGVAQSVVLPVPGNANGHAGNFAVTNTHIQQGRIGVAILPTSQAVPHVRFEKTTIEGNSDIGIIAARLTAEFSHCWTEANQGNSTASVVLDGNTVNKGNLVLVDPFYATGDVAGEGGSRILWNGGSLQGVRTAARGEVRIERADLSGDSSIRFTTEAGGVLTAGAAYADGISVPALLAEAPLPVLGRGRGLQSLLPMPRGRIWNTQPRGGRVRGASDFSNGTGYGSARISNWYSGTRNFAATGGFWSQTATCFEMTNPTGDFVGFSFTDPLGAAAPAGYYALIVSFRADQANPLISITASGGPWGGSNVPVPGSNVWTTFGGCWFFDTPVTITPKIGIKGDLVNPITVQFGAFAMLRFDSRGEAEAWFRAGQLHMTEA